MFISRSSQPQYNALCPLLCIISISHEAQAGGDPLLSRKDKVHAQN